MPYANLEQYEARAQYSIIAGHRIAHWAAGKGEVILLVHGFPSAAWDWHYQWEPLSQAYQLIALDLLGFGLSDKPHSHQYSLLEQATIIEELLSTLNVTRCHVVAHDYGNSVTQELLSRCFAGKTQLELASITFLNGGLFSESHRPLLMQKLMKSWLGPVLSRLLSKDGLRKSFTRIFGANTPPKDQEIDAIWSLISKQRGMRVMPALLKYIDERRVHRDRWLLAMQQTTTPLQFINGIEDPISGLHMLLRYRELIPDPQTHQLQLGHYPQLEGPDDVLALVKQFLRR